MKTIIILSALMLISIIAQAQTSAKVEFNDSEKKVSVVMEKHEITAIPWTYVAKDGKEYPIYITENGSCFIIRTSKKSGKEYRQYLGVETSKELCRKLNIEYHGKGSGDN